MHYKVPGRDQDLFVCQRDGDAALNGFESGLEADGAGGGDDQQVDCVTAD